MQLTPHYPRASFGRAVLTGYCDPSGCHPIKFLSFFLTTSHIFVIKILFRLSPLHISKTREVFIQFLKLVRQMSDILNSSNNEKQRTKLVCLMKLLLLVLSRLDYRNSVDLPDRILDKLQRSRRLISPSSDSTSVRCSLAASSDSHRVQFAVLLFMNSPQSQLVSPSQSGRSLPSVHHWFLSVPLYQCWLTFFL